MSLLMSPVHIMREGVDEEADSSFEVKGSSRLDVSNGARPLVPFGSSIRHHRLGGTRFTLTDVSGEVSCCERFARICVLSKLW